MKPRRLHSATIFSMVAGSPLIAVATLVIVAAGAAASRRRVNAPKAAKFEQIAWFRTRAGIPDRVPSRSRPMVILRPIGHIAAWLVWHSTGRSILRDLDAPEPPGA